MNNQFNNTLHKVDLCNIKLPEFNYIIDEFNSKMDILNEYAKLISYRCDSEPLFLSKLFLVDKI